MLKVLLLLQIRILKTSMKIFFLLQHKNLPSSRIRVLNLIPELSKHDVTSTYRYMPKSMRESIEVLFECRKYDIVFIQKKLFSPLYLLLLRFFSKKLFFDFDDAIFLKDASSNEKDFSNPKAWKSRSKLFKFRLTCKLSDFVIAGNNYLKNEAIKYTNKVAIIPSSVPFNTSTPNRLDNKKRSVPVIGWIGTTGNHCFLALFKDSLQKIAKTYPFKLRIISDSPYFIEGVDCEFHQWILEEQELEIAQLDIGLMPLFDTPWTRGKCSYKLLQYMAAGVPFIASAIGMNIDIAKDNTVGYAVNNSRELEDRLIYLLTNKEKRISMGKTGSIIVKEEYSISAICKALIKIMHRIV